MKFQGPDFTPVKEQLFGPAGTGGRLDGTTPFELKAQNVVVPQDFFTLSSETDFKTLVEKVRTCQSVQR